MIPFHRPSIGEAEIDAAVEVLRSGWLTTGPKAHAFEQLFADKTGARYAIAVNSGTAALHLALEALRIGPGDEVVVPTYAFAACGAVVAHLGARPILADVDEDGLLGPAQLEAVLTLPVRAVMPVHLAGMPADVAALGEVTLAPILEDAAHSVPSPLQGIAAAYSFYATKPMTTAEGGMLVTNDAFIANRAKVMRLHGIAEDAWNRYGPGGSWAYSVTEAGYKYNLTDLAAAIGLVQLERSDHLWEQRKSIALRYDAALGGSDLLELPPRSEGHGWHLYQIRLRLEEMAITRDEVIERMAQAEVGTSVHFIPLHLMPFYQRRYGYNPGDFPNAERLYQRTISLPIWPGMSPSDVDHVADVLLSVLSPRMVAA